VNTAKNPEKLHFPANETEKTFPLGELGAFIGIGAGLGLLFGLLFDQLASGLLVGASVGTAIGALLELWLPPARSKQEQSGGNDA
jgi:hypothetical protein